MQQPMDTCVRGINTSSESSLPGEIVFNIQPDVEHSSVW